MATTLRQQSRVPLYGIVPSGLGAWAMMRDLATSAGVEQSEATKPEQMAEHRWQSRLSPVYTTMFFLAVSYLVGLGLG